MDCMYLMIHPHGVESGYMFLGPVLDEVRLAVRVVHVLRSFVIEEKVVLLPVL